MRSQCYSVPNSQSLPTRQRIHIKDNECKKGRGGGGEPPDVLPSTQLQQHRLPKAPANTAALPSASSSCWQKLEGRKENSCQELQLSKGCQNLVIMVYGVFNFFLTREQGLEKPQRGSSGECHIAARLTSLETLPPNHWLLAILPLQRRSSQVRGKKYRKKGFRAAFFKYALWCEEGFLHCK